MPYFSPNISDTIAISTLNSSTANLASGASFTGTSESTIGINSIQVVFKADQNCTIQVQQSNDGTNWDIVDSYTTTANTGDARSFNSLTAFYRVIVTNNGAVSTTFFRLSSTLMPFSENLPRALSQGGNLKTSLYTDSDGPITSTLINTKQALDVAINGQVTASPLPPTGSGFTFGLRATNSTAIVPIEETTYTEQTTNGQRSIASASANDTALGTGARTVKITYLDQTGAGPFTETLTLNGTTGVNTVNTNICFIEKIEVVTVGSGGSNAGIITLFTAINKGGTVIGTIGLGDNKTNWAHHYVPTGKICYISGISYSNDSTNSANGANFFLKSAFPTIANSVSLQISDFLTMPGSTPTNTRTYVSTIQVAGFARVTLFVQPFAGAAQTQFGAFDYIDN